jgi:hypothetical protein
MILDCAERQVKSYVVCHTRAKASPAQQGTTLLLFALALVSFYRAPLLDRAGSLRKDRVGICSDQTYGAHYKHQNYSQHHCVLSNVLALLV